MNLTQEWRCWDNLESVDLIVERGQYDYSLSPVTAKRRALTFRELVSSGGAYVAQDLVWLLPSEFAPDGSPRLSDRIVDAAGDEWTILEASWNKWRTTWRLTTRNLVLSADLSDTVTMTAPDAAQDLTGVRTPTYSTVVSGLPAKILETDAAAEERLGKRQAVRRFTCWVGRRIYPAANYRIVSSAGTIYQITGWRAADRFDVLQELDLEIVQ